MKSINKFEKKLLETLLLVDSGALTYLTYIQPIFYLFKFSKLKFTNYFICLGLVFICTLLTFTLYEKYIPEVEN